MSVSRNINRIRKVLFHTQRLLGHANAGARAVEERNPKFITDRIIRTFAWRGFGQIMNAAMKPRRRK